MKTLSEICDILRAHRRELDAEYGVKWLGVFGSFARGEAQPESDVDVLVEFFEPPSLFGFLKLERRLSELLGLQVDLVTRAALKPHIGQRILTEVVPI